MTAPGWYARGPRGAGITSSTSDPSGAPEGGTGSVHINTTSGALFRWSGTAWTPDGNVKGPQGIQGDTGPANSLSIGTVTGGGAAAASITGTAPSQTLNLTLPEGPKGDKGDKGDPGDGDVSTAQLNAAIATRQAVSEKAQANGYAPLDGSGLVPAVHLPSYVDDVLEYANLAGFPGTGTSGKIYVAQDTGKIYRWPGSAYVEISPSPGSTDSVTEGTTNLYYTQTRADARVTAGLTARTVSAGTGLTGGGTLAADRSFALSASSIAALTDARRSLGPTVESTASSGTPTPAITSASHQYNLTALAANATFGAPTGTPVDGGTLMLRVKDNGTARTLAFNAAFRALGVTLPTTTTANKTLYIGCRWNAADSKWDVLATGVEA